MEVDLIEAASMPLPSSLSGVDIDDGITITYPLWPNHLPLGHHRQEHQPHLPRVQPLRSVVTLTSFNPQLNHASMADVCCCHSQPSQMPVTATREPMDKYHCLPICCHHLPPIQEPHQDLEPPMMGVVPKAATAVPLTLMPGIASNQVGQPPSAITTLG